MRTKMLAGIIALVIIGGVTIAGIVYYIGSNGPTKPTHSETSPDPASTLQVIEIENDWIPPSDVEHTEPNSSPASDPLTAMESYLSKIKNDESIREQLYRLYGRFNGLVGNYDNYKTMTSDDWNELLEYNFLQPEVYMKFAEVTANPDLTRDFMNVASLITWARVGLSDGTPSDDDMKALRYAYEIVNDIQMWSLPQGGENEKVRHKFGASFALDEHSHAVTIEEWIKHVIVTE